jgi:hypothetical protein
VAFKLCSAVSLSGRAIITGFSSVISGEQLAPVTGLSSQQGRLCARFGGQRITFRYARGTQGAALPMQSNCCSHSVASQTTSTKQRLALHVSRIHSLRTRSLILKFSQLQPPCRLLRVRYCCASPAQPPAAPCSTTRRSLWLLAENQCQTSNQISRIRGTDGAMKLPNPGYCLRSPNCPGLACLH